MRPLREAGLWRRAVVWLVLLAPFFFGSYGLATWVSAQRYLDGGVGSLVFDWERHMPFWAWTIVPYWSIDLLYGFSLLACITRRQLDTHALRLLTAQIIAVTCFLLWPLRFTFERPALDGVFGWLFAVLAGFDKPFNQAPSLHIALLVILWVCYARYFRQARPGWRWLLHIWFALIGVSVLTTWQHHFVDLPTGALLGWLCVWMWPDHGGNPVLCARLTGERKRRSLAVRYGLGALGLAVLAAWLRGAWLWALWPALSLSMVSLNYLLFGPAGFQKRADGRLSPAACWLYAPYLLGAWINSRLWTRRRPRPDRVVDNVWLGRIPDRETARAFAAVVDMCAELPLSTPPPAYRNVPALDLVAPTLEQCREAAIAIDRLRAEGPLLVCCALGYSRSVTALAAWLLYSGKARNVDNALALIGEVRPRIVLHEGQRAVLQAMQEQHLEGSGQRPASEDRARGPMAEANIPTRTSP